MCHLCVPLTGLDRSEPPRLNTSTSFRPESRDAIRAADGLTFAFCLFTLPPPRALEFLRPQGGAVAAAHKTPARNSRLPERIHRAAWVRPQPRRNRQALHAVLARDSAQAPDQSAGKGLHPPRLEPQSL